MPLFVTHASCLFLYGYLCMFAIRNVFSYIFLCTDTWVDDIWLMRLLDVYVFLAWVYRGQDHKGNNALYIKRVVRGVQYRLACIVLLPLTILLFAGGLFATLSTVLNLSFMWNFFLIVLQVHILVQCF